MGFLLLGSLSVLWLVIETKESDKIYSHIICYLFKL